MNRKTMIYNCNKSRKDIHRYEKYAAKKTHAAKKSGQHNHYGAASHYDYYIGGACDRIWN